MVKPVTVCHKIFSNINQLNRQKQIFFRTKKGPYAKHTRAFNNQTVTLCFQYYFRFFTPFYQLHAAFNKGG